MYLAHSHHDAAWVERLDSLYMSALGAGLHWDGAMQCVAVWCSVLRCGAVWFSAVQGVAMCCIVVVQYVATSHEKRPI